jgi:branched-chain amino acid transport system substrate-binding protein
VHRSQRITLAGLICLSLALSACGSRRPMEDFKAAGSGTLEQTTTGGDNAAAGTTGGEVSGGTSGAADGAATTGGTTGGGTSGGATGGGTSGGSTGGSAGGSTGGGTSGGGAANGASDIGVTATTINLGNIVTKSGSFGPDQFTPMYYGAAAYFSDLNARGGINGRKVIFNTCDDGGDNRGNTTCARKFVDDEKVFAFVANNCLSCDGLKYISEKGVTSVGGLAIDSRDYALPHFWRYSGNMYPQNGKIGYKGNLYQGTHQYRYFKEKFGVKKAGVVYYDNSAPSKNAGMMFMKALEAEGIEAIAEPINVALPQYDSAVLDMKQKGVTAIWDSIDISGNQNLCKSIDANGLVLKAKVSTISTWSQLVGEQFDAPCRTYMFSVEDPGALSYDQTSNPEIAKFRAAMKRYFPNREGRMFQWNVDGWGSAMWFADAAASCGANLTRACIEKYLDRPKGYTARGLWAPRNNEKYNFETKKTLYRCIQVAQWDDKAKSFVTRAAYPQTCYTTPYLPYPAPAS